MKISRKSAPLVLSILATFALGACGGGSYSDPGPPSPPPLDTTAPTVSSVQAPAAGFVNRVVTLTVTASDNVGVSEVRFFVDGVLLGSDNSSPYSIDWDTSAETDGDHVLRAEAQDAAGNVGQSGDITVTVANTVQFAVVASGDEEVGPVDSAGSAQADLTVNLVTGEVTGSVTVAGITPTVAHIHDAFAGTNGPILIPLDQDAGNPLLFNVPAGALLDAAGIERLLAAALYVNVHTAANPGGELRGQILPQGFIVRLLALNGMSSAPPVASIASGRAAVTLDQVNGTLVVHAQVDGLDDATQAHVHEAYAGNNGPVLVPLAQDAMDPGHWFVENGTLTADGLAAFSAGQLYVNVHSPANPGGEIRGQIVPDGVTVMFVELEGDQEVPAVNTRAGGLAALTLDESASRLTIHVNTSRLNDASLSHLHGAYGGINGAIMIGLTKDGSNPAHWFAEEQTLDAAQLETFLSGASYVNVHSPAHPGGEIRGQVIPGDILFARGRLEGRQEVPAVNSAAGGTFAVTVDPATLTLQAHANTTGADDASAAHLHTAFAGVSGAIAVPLVQDGANVAHWSAVNAAITANQLDAIRTGGFYVNVHTPANPAGEIRGQLAPPPVEVLFTTVSGDEEVPAVASAASGTAATTVNREAGTVTLHLRASGADDATVSHIHGGFAGQNGGVLIGLTQDPGDPGHWSAVGQQFDADGLSGYLEGRLYVNLHTPAHPGGEIRGQLAPRDIQVVFSDMDGGQVVPPVASAATGIAATTVDLNARRLTAFLNSTGADDATSAGIHVGNAGENGAEVLALQQTPALPSQWSGITEPLSLDDFLAYRSGGFYAQVATPAQMNGEIRGQIVPPDAAEFDAVAPTVTLMSPGANVSGTVTLEADANDNQGIAIVRFLVGNVVIGSDDTAPYSLDWDTTTTTNGAKTLTAEAEDLAGNIGVSAGVNVTVQNAAPVTLTQIQTMVFTPICSGCHTGPTSGVLPGGMNLTSTANSFAALVNIASLQVALDRVEPGDPDNSYLIRKLEGGPGIVGARMPQGGPFLDQATINMIRQWIADGAQNN